MYVGNTCHNVISLPGINHMIPQPLLADQIFKWLVGYVQKLQELKYLTKLYKQISLKWISNPNPVSCVSSDQAKCGLKADGWPNQLYIYTEAI